MKKLFIPGFLLIIIACKGDRQRNAITNGINTSTQDASGWPARFEFGRTASQEEIAKVDIDVRPDGRGLPPGQGNVITGKSIYLAKCAACHGKGTEPGNVQLPGPRLISNSPQQVDSKASAKTIGNYWPYATTLFDYTRRAMPYNEPGSLTNDEVYHVSAYLLHANKIIEEHVIIDAKTLPAVKMPAQDRFVPDNRRGGAEVR
jgi:S-disulfanyl-L-cysteine oxidoreductase SoxD